MRNEPVSIQLRRLMDPAIPFGIRLGLEPDPVRPVEPPPVPKLRRHRAKDVPESVDDLLDSKLYSLREAATATGLSAESLRRRCVRGDIPFTRASTGSTSPIKVYGRDLKAWLARAARENRVVLDTREAADVKRRAI